MVVTTLNRRYAKSLLDLAIEQNKLGQVKEDMSSILEVIEASRELKVLLKSPVVDSDKKRKIIQEIFGKSIDELTYAFINIILSKGREAELQGIAMGFRNLYRIHMGIEEAVITTASALGDEQREDIRSKLKAITGNKIDIKEIIDPAIIGGVKIRVGDRQYNGSIAYQLEKLKRQFDSNQYIADF